MKRNFARLGDTEFDLLIIGGGITGACVARDAAARGLKVALVDKWDFSSATSAGSSKLVHGGLRYLRNFELGLVRESLGERRIWERIAPHQVRPLPFALPAARRQESEGDAQPWADAL
jgi:glycerol-3-phosphate dehydrogenase